MEYKFLVKINTGDTLNKHDKIQIIEGIENKINELTDNIDVFLDDCNIVEVVEKSIVVLEAR